MDHIAEGSQLRYLDLWGNQHLTSCARQPNIRAGPEPWWKVTHGNDIIPSRSWFLHGVWKLSRERDLDLIGDLLSETGDTPWLEFKSNRNDPCQIGKLISALSNAARLEGRETAYIIWGICDETHAVSGTRFDPFSKKVGNQEFQLWLKNKLNPAPAVEFREVDHQDGRLVLLVIPAAIGMPTAFESVPYIRIGSATPKLTHDYYRYAKLIEKLRPPAWESGNALTYVAPKDVLGMLDHSS